MTRKSNITVRILRDTMANGEFCKAGKEVSLRAADARLLIKMGKAEDPARPVVEEVIESPEDFETVEEMQNRLDVLENNLEKAKKSRAKDAATKVAEIEAEIEELEQAIAEA